MNVTLNPHARRLRRVLDEILDGFHVSLFYLKCIHMSVVFSIYVEQAVQNNV